MIASALSRTKLLRSWLARFRGTTPRAQRERLIAEIDLDLQLRKVLERAPEYPAYARSKYFFIIYIVSARRLNSPARLTVAEREAERVRLATVFALSPLQVARDLTAMMMLLAADHRQWQERRVRAATRATDGAVHHQWLEGSR